MFAIWADGTSCNLEDLEEFLTFMSDDYEIGWEEPEGCNLSDQDGE